MCTSLRSLSVRAPALGIGIGQSVRLRAMLEADEHKLAELDALFRLIDSDNDGKLTPSEIIDAAAAIAPPDAAHAAPSTTSNIPLAELPLLDRLRGLSRGTKDGGIDRPTFLTMMIDKAVADFAAGESALLPAFEAADPGKTGTVSQAHLLQVNEHAPLLFTAPDLSSAQLT